MEFFQVGRVWHYRFQVAGIRTHRSTRETCRRTALAVATEAYDAARLRARGREPVPMLRACVAQWLTAHQHIYSPAYLRSIETWARLHLGDLGGLPLTALTTARVETQRAAYAEHHAASSVSGWAKKLSVVMHWAMRRGMLRTLPYQIKPVRVQAKPKLLLPASLTGAWLAAIDAGGCVPVSLGVRLALGLGLRQSEIITARWEWLDWDRGTYTPGQTKGREATPLPVPLWLLDALRPHRRSAGLLISGDGSPMPNSFLRAPMLRANRAVGAPHITPHRLRGTYATGLAECSVPISELQRVMRHRDPRTTMGYLVPNPHLTREGQHLFAQRMGLEPVPSGPINACATPTACALQGN